MYREILCLVFVAILASIGQGRVIEKRSPGVASDVSKHIDTAIGAVGDFGSDAIDEITDFANSDGVRRVRNKGVDVANDVGESIEDAFDDAGSALGDFLGGLGRKKRSSWDPEEDLGVGSGVGSDIWDRIDKGSAAVGSFPPLIEYDGAGGMQQSYLGPLKNLVLEETRAYAAKALGKYYGNLLYKSFT